MTHSAHIDTILAEFCSRNDAEAVTLSADGVAGLQLPGGRELFVLHDDAQDRLFACTELRKLPADPALRLAFLEVAMAMNFMQHATGPTTLALKNRGLFCQVPMPTQQLTADLLEGALAMALLNAESLDIALTAALSDIQTALAAG